MSRIVTIGAATQEIFLIDRDDFAEALLEDKSVFGKIAIGTKIDIDKAVVSVGGSGANAAVALARFGHEVIYVGTIARDAAGEAVLNCFDDENVDSSFIDFVRGMTSTSVYLLDAKTSQRTILEFKGVAKKAQKIKPEDLEQINPDWVYVTSLNGDMMKLLAIFEKAHELGAKVMFNPGAAELAEKKKMIGLLSEVDVLYLNKTEAAQIVPGVVLSELLSHLSNYCETVIITDGIMGAIATNHQETYRLGVYEQTRTRDVTGAGDAFGAGFLAEYAKSGKFEKALRFASANASKVTQFYGAETGLLAEAKDLHPMPITKIENLTEWKVE